MTEEQRNEVRDILRRLVDVECSRVSDRSGDILGDWRAIIAAAEGRCTRLGLTWHEEFFVPGYIRDLLAFDESSR